jgi:hypothetical protein
VSELDEFKSTCNDFELLRMPIAKFEIAKDFEIERPLPMRRFGDDETKPIEFYDPKDPARFHIMPKGVSPRLFGGVACCRRPKLAAALG